MGAPKLAVSEPALLVVDDEPSILSALTRALRREKVRVLTCLDPQEALKLLEREHVGVVISDYKMPEMDGITFLTAVKERWPLIQRIMLTGQADDAAIEGVVNRSAVFRFLSKPWAHQALLLTIHDSFEQYRILRENAELSELTAKQNDELREQARDLEDRISRRTRQLVRAKLEWERTFDAIVDPVAIVDQDYRVVRANIAYAEHARLNIQDVPGRRCHELVADRASPCTECPLTEAIEGDPPRGVDIDGGSNKILNVSAFPLRGASAPPGSRASVLSAADGVFYSDRPSVSVIGPPVQIAAMSQAAVCQYRDVTEERALSDKLARTEKLAALGLFVGGVAHEINNPLGAILATAQLVLRDPGDPEDVHSALTDIETSALRCKRIIDSLQSFARSQHVADRLIQLDALVRDTVESFRKDYQSTDPIAIEYDVAEGTPPVRGDAALIHQLLRNLLQNADHAASEQGGRVCIGVGLDAVDPRRVRIEVSDNGHGIDEKKMKRIFDPFFTTKNQSKGTGLGLSICHRIVEQHRGQMEVDSKPDVGTTFRIFLPAAHLMGRGMEAEG